MKIKEKNFEIEQESKDFVALKYSGRFRYHIKHYIDLFQEMKEKGYKLIFEVEWKYLIFEKIMEEENKL